MEDRVILDVIDDLFVLVPALEASQEWGVKKGGTWRTLSVPDQRLGGYGQP